MINDLQSLDCGGIKREFSEDSPEDATMATVLIATKLALRLLLDVITHSKDHQVETRDWVHVIEALIARSSSAAAEVFIQIRVRVMTIRVCRTLDI